MCARISVLREYQKYFKLFHCGQHLRFWESMKKKILLSFI